MAYLGNAPVYAVDVRDRFTGNGSTTTFTLSRQPTGAGGLLVMVSGVIQDSLTYGVSGKVLTFTQAPPAPMNGATTNIEVVYLQVAASPWTANWRLPIGTNTGTGDAIAVSYSPAVSSLTDNLVLRVVMQDGFSNTTTGPTFSPNGLTPKIIVGADGTPAIIGQLSGSFDLVYNAANSNWRVSTSATFSKNAGNLIGTGTIAETITVGASGQRAGFRSIPSNAQTSAYTIALTDVGWSVDTNSSVTIPPNSSVAFAIGDTVTITNTSSSSISIISGSGVTLRQAGTTNTGNRVLSAYGQVTVRKTGSDTWFVAGAGLV